jgi:hypothetical protein
VSEAIRRLSGGTSRRASRAQRSGAWRSGKSQSSDVPCAGCTADALKYSLPVYSGHGAVNWTLMYRLISSKSALLCVTNTNPLSLQEAASR